MTLDYFTRARRASDIQNLIDLTSAVMEEHGQQNPCLEVDDGKGKKMQYFGSAVMATGTVQYHYFLLGNGNGLFAIGRLKPGEGLEMLSEPEYLTFSWHSESMFCAERQDGLQDLFIRGKRVCGNLISVDELTLGGIFNFVQLDFETGERSLICVEGSHGIYSPKGVLEFQDYYTKKIYQYGYEGRLDMEPLSRIIQVFNEVCQCIFTVAPYKQVNVGDWDE